jgi:hypothetical protein
MHVASHYGMRACSPARDGASYETLEHSDPRDYFSQIVFLLSNSYDVTPLPDRGTKRSTSEGEHHDAVQVVQLCRDVSAEHVASFPVADNPIASTFEVMHAIASTFHVIMCSVCCCSCFVRTYACALTLVPTNRVHATTARALERLLTYVTKPSRLQNSVISLTQSAALQAESIKV